MRQISMFGYFLSVRSEVSYKSNMLDTISAFFAKNDILKRLQTVVDKNAGADEQEIEKMILEMCPQAFSEPKEASKLVDLGMYSRRTHRAQSDPDLLCVRRTCSFPVMIGNTYPEWCKSAHSKLL